MAKNKLIVIDLFCGIGGFSYGLEQNKYIENYCGIDNDNDHKDIYSKNSSGSFLNFDLLSPMTAELEKLLDNYRRFVRQYPSENRRLLIASPPCQPFSQMTNRLERNEDDERREGMKATAEIIKKLDVEFFLIENVPGIARSKEFQDFRAVLGSEYEIQHSVVDMSEFGIPQIRQRFIIFGVKYMCEAIFMEQRDYFKVLNTFKTTKKTMKQAIGKGEGQIHLYREYNLSSTNRERWNELKQGENWSALPDRLKTGGKNFGSYYRRHDYNKPAPTLTTNCMEGSYGFHPTQCRYLRMWEVAALQTFPETFDFKGKQGIPSIELFERQIGNAVPPAFAKILGKALLKCLKTDVRKDK